jgi:hypothetical protein
MFYDEAFFKRDGSIIRSWYLKGIGQSAYNPATKEKVGVSGAINHREWDSLFFDVRRM